MYNDPRIGIAIGKLPSQLSANFYMSVLVDFLQNELHVEALEMFMDDFVILDTKGFAHASAMVAKIRDFCRDILHITLHPKKIYIQPYQKGVLYVGAMVKPGRIYISNRTLGAAFRRIHFYNKKLQEGEGAAYAEKFVATVNSYLGLMVHYNTYNKRKRLVSLFDRGWYKFIYVEGHFRKVVLRKQYKPTNIIKQKIRHGKYKQLFMPELDEMDSNPAAPQRGLEVIYPDGAPRPRPRHKRNKVSRGGVLPPPDPR